MVYNVKDMPDLTDIYMEADTPWITFYNEETGMGFSGIQLNYSNAGLYRGEYYHKEADKIAIKWISWVVGNTDKPNFHVPSSFGVLKLEN